jgi:hypothetical protein
MKLIYYIIALILFFSSLALSQKVVVSEYINATPDGEYTELLVIQDTLSMVGYSIRDNSDVGFAWQGGVKFKDVPLWKNLRAGTIIVIKHRGGVVDDNKADGYVEIGADADIYFEKFMSTGSIADWDIRALSLNETHDMIQLRDENDNHVHVLAHMNPDRINDVFASLPNPKVGFPGLAQRSTRVYPGTSLSDFNGGLSSSYVLSDMSDKGGIGLPNGNDKGAFTNHLFWRTLREPKWEANIPNLRVAISADYKSIELTWDKASNIKDPNEGYLIVRFKNNKNQPFEPLDGHIYKPGDSLGNYTIIDTLPDLTNEKYTDNFDYGTFDCGTKFAYNLFIYRYQASDNSKVDLVPENARGRSYNGTEYGATEYLIKEIPPSPVIKTLDGRLEYCRNEKIKIEADIRDKIKFDFKWYNGADEISGTDYFIVVNSDGNYRLVLTDKNTGCDSTSNELLIKILDASEAVVTNKDDFKTFSRDTIIQICSNQSIRLLGIANPSTNQNTYQWFKDGTLLTNQTEITINKSGIYKFIVMTNGLCSDTSIVIDVRVFSPDYSLSTASLNFDFDTQPDQDLIITNNSDQELIFTPSDITIAPPGDFVIINPTITKSNPLKIPAKSSVTVTIHFQSTTFGTKQAKITFSSICNFFKVCNLEGYRENKGVTILLAQPANGLNFDLVPINCDEKGLDTVKIVVSGDKPLKVIMQPLKTNAFEVDKSNKFAVNPSQLVPKSKTEPIPVRVIATTKGIYYDTLKFAYREYDATPDKISDTLSIPLAANVIDPQISQNYNELDLSDMLTCFAELDTFLIVNISDNYDFEIITQPEDKKVTITNSLPLVLSGSKPTRINLKIKFINTSDFVSTIQLSPCGRIIQLNVKPPKNDLKLTYIDSVKFGIIKNCEFPGDFSLPLNINATANGGYIGQILRNGQDFGSTVVTGNKIIKGDNLLSISFKSVPAGIYNDSLKFIIEPCNDTVLVFLSGERIDPDEASYDKTKIIFAKSDMNQISQEQLTIKNTNQKVALIINSIKVQAPFILIKPTLAEMPLTIQPNNTYVAVFEYRREIPDKFTDSIEINSEQPCKMTRKLPIEGETVDNREFMVTFDLPTRISAKLGEEFQLPVNLTYPTNFDFKFTAITSGEVFFSYSASVMTVNSINDGPITSGIKNPIINDNKINKFSVKFDVPKPDSLNSGNIFNLNLEPLLGYTIKTKIKIDSVKFAAKLNVASELDSTSVDIIGDCNIKNRTLGVGGVVKLSINGSVPVNKIAEIQFGVVTEDKTNITIYNSIGDKVLEIVNQNLKAGEYSTFVNTGNFPNGMYYIIMESGTAVRRITMPVMN